MYTLVPSGESKILQSAAEAKPWFCSSKKECDNSDRPSSACEILRTVPTDENKRSSVEPAEKARIDDRTQPASRGANPFRSIVDAVSDKVEAVSSMTVSAVVPTRNRCAHAVACVKTILANAGLLELLVIDQSDGHETEQALQEINDSRLNYVRTSTRGVAWARNIGFDLSHGEVIAFTDDDCRVAPDWILSLVEIFKRDPGVSIVCGRVRVPAEIRPLGFTESFEPEQREWVGRYPRFGRDWGITANLSVRRTIIAQIGKFDVMLGAGAPLRSGGEPDFLFRALRYGAKIINAREVEVDHLGVRAPGRESSILMRGYGTGTGAALFKHVRLGDVDAMRVYAGFLSANVKRIAASVMKGEGPRGLGYLASFISGSLASCRYGIDRRQRLYVSRGRKGSSR